MSQNSKDNSDYSHSDDEQETNNKDLVKYSKKNIFLYDKKCRIALHLGVIYKNLTKSAANSINLDKITSKIQSMIDKDQIYLRDVGPIILGITKIVVKKTNILFEDIEELTKLRINSKGQIRTVNKEYKEIIEEDDGEDRKDLVNLNKKQISENEIKESTGSTALNINSLDDDIFNFKNSNLLELGKSLAKNKKNNRYTELTFSKDIIELNNDDMIRRTIQKMSKLNDSDIKDIISANKTIKDKSEIQFVTEKKNSKTLQNLRDMLFNKNNNTNNFLGNNINNESSKNNIDNNNKDVEEFFTVIKSQIEDSTNNINNQNIDGNNDNNVNFDFDININDLKDEKFNSNIKYKIDKDDSIENNLKTKVNKKTIFLHRGKLKYDKEIEIEMEKPKENLSNKEKKALEKQLERKNKEKLEELQFMHNCFQFDKNALTSFQNEKYEYLLPKFLEGKEDEETAKESEIKSTRKDQNITDYTTNVINLNNNSINESNEKSDISRLNRLTISNKKKLSLGNFDTENRSLFHDLSRMSLDKNDFKGSTSFFEKLKEIERNDISKNEEKIENIENEYNFNDVDLIEPVNNNQNILNEKKGDKKHLSEDIKEEEDAVLLKEDLEKNVFINKKSVSFTKIRNKLDNKEKFVEPKLFYDLLLLAQKGDIEMTQKKLMNNESIHISLN